MSIIGLREQTVHGAKSIADACARHRWNIPADYNVTVDCLDRHTDLRDKPALYYEDDEGRVETYTFGKIAELSRRFANAMVGLGIKRGDVVAVHLPQRPETAIAHMGLYRIGAIALPISKLFGPDALMYRLNNSAAKAILLEPESVRSSSQSARTLRNCATSSSPAATRAASPSTISSPRAPTSSRWVRRTPRIRSC